MQTSVWHWRLPCSRTGVSRLTVSPTRRPTRTCTPWGSWPGITRADAEDLRDTILALTDLAEDFRAGEAPDEWEHHSKTARARCPRSWWSGRREPRRSTRFRSDPAARGGRARARSPLLRERGDDPRRDRRHRRGRLLQLRRGSGNPLSGIRLHRGVVHRPRPGCGRRRQRRRADGGDPAKFRALFADGFESGDPSAWSM